MSINDCKCDTKNNYGDFNDSVKNCLKFTDQFSLRAVNWYGPDNKKLTYLESGKNILGDWIHTKDDVLLIQNQNLDNSLLYIFSRNGCSGGDNTFVRYGQAIQLKSVKFSDIPYIQCSTGDWWIQSTCSRYPTDGNCALDKWQTFIIKSDQGKSDGSKICYGDKIRITQTIENAAKSHNDITSADGTQVWGTNTGSNINSVLQILPPSGTIYKNVTDDMKEYLTRFNINSCKQNIFYCPRAWWLEISNFVKGLSIILIIIFFIWIIFFLLHLSVDIKNLIT